MKKWIEISILAVVILAIFYGAAQIYLQVKGGAIIKEALRSATGADVKIGSFNIYPFFNLEIYNLDIQDTGKAGRIFISPSLPNFIVGKTALNKLVIEDLQIAYKRVPPPVVGEVVPVEKVKAPERVPQKRAGGFVIKRLKIKNGKINFIDYTAGPQGLNIIVKDLNFSLNNLYLAPVSTIAIFELSARIPWQEGKEEGKISAEGWLNLYKKDMQAVLKIEDIDGIYLYPYYSNWVDLEKARIESAKLSFTSNIRGLNNDVVAECRIELTDIVRKPRPEGEPQEKAEKLADVVLGMLEAMDDGRYVLDFKIPTKMDRPEFGFGDIKQAFETKLAEARKGEKGIVDNIFYLPTKLLEGIVRSASDVTKAAIGGAASVGSELKGALEGAFTREAPQGEENPPAQ